MMHDFDMKNIRDERAYHNTVIFIYLTAVRDVMGNVDTRIGNSLNQGYFTYVADLDRPLTTTEIHKIDDRMRELIEEDLPINTEIESASEASSLWSALGYREKAELFKGRDPEEPAEILELEGYKNCLYTRVLPSTGYISKYELRPYNHGLLLRVPTALDNNEISEYRNDDKLYDAFAESKRMRRQTGIGYLADINTKIREGEIDEVIAASEAYQTHQLREYAEMIVNGGKRIVLIAGPSSSGKTTTAKRVCANLTELTGREPLYMGTDDYFVDREYTPVGPDGKPDFEGLNALDLELFNTQMSQLLAGEEVDLPEFDFIEGKKIFGKRITRLEDGQILVIEGIHSLNDILTERINSKHKFKIYISPLTQIGIDRHNRISTADARLLRRMVRDNQFRGYSAEKTLDNWPKVRAGESVNIFPYSSSGDVVFNSSTVYETNLLRTYAEPLLMEIPESSDQYPDAQRILNFMKYFDKIDHSNAVPHNSILREFIGMEDL